DDLYWSRIQNPADLAIEAPVIVLESPLEEHAVSVHPARDRTAQLLSENACQALNIPRTNHRAIGRSLGLRLYGSAVADFGTTTCAGRARNGYISCWPNERGNCVSMP